MRGIGGLAFFIALLLLSRWPATADEMARAQGALAALRADLTSGRVVRAEVLTAPYRISTPIPISPDRLKGYATRFKGVLTIDFDRRRTDDLVQAIDGTQLQVDDVGSDDLRWGAIFFDQSGTRIHSIYLNSCYYGGAGRGGYIDGAYMRLNRSLIAWFESNVSNRDGPCADGPPDWRRKIK